MKYLMIPLVSLVFLISCERPVTEPIEFARLCGPSPTQAQAEAAVKECVNSRFRNPQLLIITDVVIKHRADWRPDGIGKRVYGWEIGFYAKTAEEIKGNKFSKKHYIGWNNGNTLGFDYGWPHYD